MTHINNSGGYTLVELLVVVALVGILSAVGIPMYTGYIQGARDKEAQVVVRSIAAAQETYMMYNRSYFSAPCDSASAQLISERLLSGSKLNTAHFNYCTTVDGALAKQNYTVTATNKVSGKQFRLDQDANELTIVDGLQRAGF
jgi:prepilin-type N-terminal cleavage/methylation domain-containing protein